jgi:hypothetical protein
VARALRPTLALVVGGVAKLAVVSLVVTITDNARDT